MQIVIDIPEEIYEASQMINVKYEDTVQIPLEIIANAIPLPKGHGRLIDADELLKKSYRIDDSATLSTRDVVNEEEIDSASTIIEADKQTPSYLWECERCGKLIPYMADFCHECAYELFGEPPKPFEPAQESEDKRNKEYCRNCKW